MTEIPAELVAAQRELQEARQEHERLCNLTSSAWERLIAGQNRYAKAWGDFQQQVGRQVQGLALPAGEGR
jgi:hypothetical protein